MGGFNWKISAKKCGASAPWEKIIVSKSQLKGPETIGCHKGRWGLRKNIVNFRHWGQPSRCWAVSHMEMRHVDDSCRTFECVMSYMSHMSYVCVCDMSHIRHSAFHAAVLDVFWYFLSDLMCVVEAASLISCALLHVCCRYVEEVTSWISCALLHVCCCCLSHDVLRVFFCDNIIFVRVLSLWEYFLC